MNILKSKRFYLLILVAIAGVFLFSVMNNSDKEAIIKLQGKNKIVYKGKINKDNVDAFEKLFLNNSEKIKTLIISSGGGSGTHGLRLGRLVRDHQLKVIVKRICFSSCANHVVTASPEVVVRKGAHIGWHGGGLQPMYKDPNYSWLAKFLYMFLSEPIDQVLKSFLLEETEFFKTIQADQIIPVLGMMPKLNDRKKENYEFYSYDLSTLRKLGINISFEEEQVDFYLDGQKIVHVFTLSDVEFQSLLASHNKRVDAYLIEQKQTIDG